MTDKERGHIENRVWELMRILPVAVNKALNHPSAQPPDSLVVTVLNALLECFSNGEKVSNEPEMEELPSRFMREWENLDDGIFAC